MQPLRLLSFYHLLDQHDRNDAQPIVIEGVAVTLTHRVRFAVRWLYGVVKWDRNRGSCCDTDAQGFELLYGVVK